MMRLAALAPLSCDDFRADRGLLHARRTPRHDQSSISTVLRQLRHPDATGLKSDPARRFRVLSADPCTRPRKR